MNLDLSGLVFAKAPRFKVNNIQELFSINGLEDLNYEVTIDVVNASGYDNGNGVSIKSGSAVFVFNPRKYDKNNLDPTQYFEIRNKDELDVSEMDTIVKIVNNGKVELPSLPNSNTFSSYTVYSPYKLYGADKWLKIENIPVRIDIIDDIPYAIFPNDKDYEGWKLEATYQAYGSYLDGVKVDYSNLNDTPDFNSNNPVTSKGIAKALSNKMDNITFKTINNESIIGEGNIEIKTTNIVNSSGEVVSFQSPTPVLSIINGDKDFYERQIIEINIDNYSELEFYDIQFSDNLSLDLGLNNGKFRLLASSLHDDFNGYIKVRSYSIANGTSWSDYGLLKVLIKALPTKLGNPIIVDDTNKGKLVDNKLQVLKSHYEGIDSGTLIEKNTILDISESNDKLIVNNELNNPLEYDIETNEGIIEKGIEIETIEGQGNVEGLVEFYPLTKDLKSNSGNNDLKVTRGKGVKFVNGFVNPLSSNTQIQYDFPNNQIMINQYNDWTISYYHKWKDGRAGNTSWYAPVQIGNFRPYFRIANSGENNILFIQEHNGKKNYYGMYNNSFRAEDIIDMKLVHLTFTYDKKDNGKFKMYINDKLVPLDTFKLITGGVTTDHLPDNKLQLGYTQWSTTAYLSNLRIYNRVLSDEEIKEIYDNGIVDKLITTQSSINHSLSNPPTKAILKDSDVSIKVDNKELEKSNTTLDIDNGLSTSDLSGLEFSADTFDVEISNPDKVKELKLIPIEEVSQ